MKMQKSLAHRSLPIIGFNSENTLTVTEYLAKAKAMAGEDVELTSKDVRKLRYSLRVFKGMAAGARQRDAQEQLQHHQSVTIDGKDG